MLERLSWLIVRAVAALLLAVVPGVAHAGCAASAGAGSITFAPSTSYDVQAGTIRPVAGLAGLACTGSTLSLLGGSTAKATIISARGFVLRGAGTDGIPYAVSADSAGTQTFTQGSTIDFMSSNILSLLGIGSASNFNAPLYARLTGIPNVAADTYTDQLTVTWDYSVCNGVQIGSLCVGYETGTLTLKIDVKLEVSRDCRIATRDIAFGSAPLASQFRPVTQSISVDCTKGATYKVAFTSGRSGTSRPWRTMTGSAGSLQYNIYRPDGTTIWDETNPNVAAAPGTGATTPTQIQSFVAKVNPAQATPPAGTYTDQVVAVVTF
jgi:spore coat protein U-like protein